MYNGTFSPLDHPFVVAAYGQRVEVELLDRPWKTVGRSAAFTIDEWLEDIQSAANPPPACRTCAKEAVADALLRHHRGLRQFAAGRRSRVQFRAAGEQLTIRPTGDGRFVIRWKGDESVGWSRESAAQLAATFAAIRIVWRGVRWPLRWCRQRNPELAALDEVERDARRPERRPHVVRAHRPT